MDSGAGGAISTVEQTIAQRAATHGNYPEQAATAQALKAIMHCAPNWGGMDADAREALDLIATKIARVLHGDPRHADTWHDICGYSKLVEMGLI